jgi:Fic family protein
MIRFRRRTEDEHIIVKPWVPKYVMTRKAQEHIETLERSSWLIQNMLIMPKHEVWFKRQVAVRRAAATTRIEGATLGDDDVKALARRTAGANLTEDERANVNALAAYRLIDDLSDDPAVPVNELLIRQLNREFLRDLSDVLTPGKYRTGQNTVGGFAPPDQGDVPDLMREFSAWLEREDGTHPVVRAALAHIQFVAIHPFWDANGRVARGLATLILQRSEVNFKRLASLESYLYRHRDDYFTAIERTLGETFSRDYDATRWIEFFARSLAAHSDELQRELTDWHRRMEVVYKEMDASDISRRQADGVAFAIQMGRLTRADYAEITGVSELTASRDLARLVTKEWIEPLGEGRGRYYTARERSENQANE